MKETEILQMQVAVGFEKEKKNMQFKPDSDKPRKTL